MGSVIPVSRSLTLCDAIVKPLDGKANIIGLFHAIRVVRYPYDLSHFCVFAQLSGGLGETPVHVEVRSGTSGRLMYATVPQTLTFPNRDFLMQVAFEVRQCRFKEPGTYLMELYSDDRWICDTTLLLR